MNIIHKLSALPAAALALLLLLSSCEVTPLQGEEEDRDVITFSAVTGYDSSSTKTSYSGVTGGTPAKERIDWVAGDRFKLACAQTTPTSYDYEIDGSGITAAGTISRATKINPVVNGTLPNSTPKANGLQWGTAWPHQFYAVYPSTASLSTSGKITATIPASQSPRATDPTTSTTSGGKTNTRVHPDMTNCLMWSGTSVASKGKFTLRFTPMVTTFQFTVGGDGTGAGDITISSVELLSSNVALCGGLTAQVTGTGATAEIAQRGGSVSYTLPSSGTGSSVTFTLPANTKINDTQSLTFTLFVYPTGRTVDGQDILDGLTVKYTTSVGGRALALKYSATATTTPNEWVKFPAGRKINIENLQLPAQLEYWRYSITIGNHEEEISDVAVNPVQVEAWDEEDYPYVLDEMTPRFSVSERKKVIFAPGNLLFKATKSGDTYTNQRWEFAEHQWDYYYVGTNGVTGLTGPNYGTDGPKIYDHFGWATAGNGSADETHLYYQPWMVNFSKGVASNNDYGYGPYSTPSSWTKNDNLPYGAVEGNTWRGSTVELNCEWGIHFDDDGNERQTPAAFASYSRTWYTLSAYEWDYLLTSRPAAGQLYGAGQIYVVDKYINGVILLPDRWELPQGCAFVSGINNTDNKYYASAADAAQGPSGSWEKMEAAGAVFLPAAGSRGGLESGDGSNVNLFTNGNRYGYYWSSSHSDFDQMFGGLDQGAMAYILGFEVNIARPEVSNCSVKGNSTPGGCCVRLVHD